MSTLSRFLETQATRARRMYHHRFASNRRSTTFYEALEHAVYAPQYFFHILASHKIVYVEVPKAASSTLTKIMTNTAGIDTSDGISHEKLPSPYDVGLDRFHDLMHDPEALIFGVTRHPYDRLLSCYRDKFMAEPFDAGSVVYRFVRPNLTSEELKTVNPALPLPLDAFVSMACRTAYARVNGHWSAMSDLLPRELLNFVGRVDQIERVFERLRQAGVANSAFPDQPLNLSPTPACELGFSAEQLRRINAAYASDFETFGYKMLAE